MKSPLLTIMVPTTKDRYAQFRMLGRSIFNQIFDNSLWDKVEFIWEEDNKEISVGAKRQLLLERARGEFVVGIDSDDAIAETYVKDIINAIESNRVTDHVGFFERCIMEGSESKSIFSIKYQKWAENVDGYDHIRCANPKSVIRRTKALQVGFPDLRFGEDRIFSENVTPLLTSEVFIEKELYIYKPTPSPHNERYGITA